MQTITMFKIYSLISTLAAGGLFGGYFIPSKTTVEAHNSSVQAPPVFMQHPVLLPVCGITRHVTSEVTVHSCERGETHFLARNNFGIMLTFGEFLDLCKFNRSANVDAECTVVNTLSNITSVFKCPDKSYFVKNTAIFFLNNNEMTRLCT